MSGALKLLQQAVGRRGGTDSDQWRWYDWVPWYALAIVLAELCSGPHGASTEHAWMVAESSYLYYEKNVADGDEGLLWKPITRLLRKVKALRASSTPDFIGGTNTSVTAPEAYLDQPFYDNDLSVALGDFDLQSGTQIDKIPPMTEYNPADGVDPVTGLSAFTDSDFSQAWESFMQDISQSGR